MSVTVIHNSSINRAFNIVQNLAFDAPNPWACHGLDKLREFNKNGYGKLLYWPTAYHFRGFEYMSRWCAIFNLRNYTTRYKDDFHRVTFKPCRDKCQPVTRQDIAQAITTLQCLRYNISDYYLETPQFRALEWLINQLRNILLDSSPEMLSAEWG